MIMNNDNVELSMRYEGLATAVFECHNWQDPWHISNANPFDAHLVTGPNNVPDDRCREMLHTVVDVAIWKHKETEALVQSLLAFKEQIRNMTTQELAADVVNGLIELLEANGY